MKGNSNRSYVFDGKGVLALIGGFLFAVSLVGLFNVFCLLVFKINFQYENFYQFFITAAGFLGAIFAFDYFICRPSIGRKLNFNMSVRDLGTHLLIFPMMFGMMLIAEFFTAIIPTTGPFFGEFYQYFLKLMSGMTRDKATLILFVVIVAPVLEEIVFRGIIMKGLINKGLNPMKAIIISAVIFGIVHQNPWQFVGAGLLGCVLGLVYYKTKSLLASILLHAFNNLLSAILLLTGHTESLAQTFQVSEFLILGAGIVIFGIFYYLFMKKIQSPLFQIVIK
jgi:membrane protease YdiL (CAAX protease family)